MQCSADSGLAALLAGAMPLLAQQSIIIPPDAAARDGNGAGSIAGFVQRARQQVLVGGAWLASAQNHQLTALTFRRDGFVAAFQGGEASVRVRLSASPSLDVDRPARDFDANHKVAPSTVYQGTLRLPPSARLPNRNGATWSGEHTVTIPLGAYQYSGGSLCIDIEGEPVAGSSTAFWGVDHEVDGIAGRATQLGVGCGSLAVRGNRTLSVSPRSLRPGASASFVNLGPPNSPAVFLVGFTPLPWPLDLAFLGAPGCYAHVMPDVMLPGSVGQGLGGGRPGGFEIDIPFAADPPMLGACFYTQVVNFEAARLTTTNGLKLELAGVPPGFQAATVTSGNAAGRAFPAAGDVEVGRLPVMRLAFD
jgi:hypothetical protein